MRDRDRHRDRDVRDVRDVRERDRDRDRERDDRDKERRRRGGDRLDKPDRRRRSPSVSPPRQGRRRRDTRSRSRSKSKERIKVKTAGPTQEIVDRAPKEAEQPEMTEEEAQMASIMGFSGFNSTKGKQVKGNSQGEVHVVLKRKYRQYMNRRGGFNRPLDFVA